MKDTNTGLYKGLGKNQRLHESVFRAYVLLRRDLKAIIAEEEDFTSEPNRRIGSQIGAYSNDYTYPDGCKVFKIMIPDISREAGEGYHGIAVVAAPAAKSAEDIGEAIKKASEVKVKRQKGVITKETIVVLSDQLEFEQAQKLRWQFNQRLDTRARDICIYSVKNPIGIAKNVVGRLAKFFAVRAEALKKIYPKLSAGLQKLFWVCEKRAERLLNKVNNYIELIARNKEPWKNQQARYWLYINKMRKKLEGILKFWVDPELQYYDDGVERAREIIYAAAERNGIELYTLEAMREMEKIKHASVGGGI